MGRYYMSLCQGNQLHFMANLRNVQIQEEVIRAFWGIPKDKEFHLVYKYQNNNLGRISSRNFHNIKDIVKPFAENNKDEVDIRLQVVVPKYENFTTKNRQELSLAEEIEKLKALEQFGDVDSTSNNIDELANK
jgi:hypothetical protein